MSQIVNLNKRTRLKLAKQIADLATPAARKAQSAGLPVGLAEHFEVWKLLEKAFKPGASFAGVPLSKFAKPTRHWEHIVRHGGAATEMVSSKRERAGWKLQAISSSPLAARIDGVIRWLDQNDDSGAVVRLLVVAKFGLYAFWLFEKAHDEVVLIDSMRPIVGLKTEQKYSAEAFLEALFKESATMPPPVKIPREARRGSPFDVKRE
jgi:hypothetical protein